MNDKDKNMVCQSQIKRLIKIFSLWYLVLIFLFWIGNPSYNSYSLSDMDIQTWIIGLTIFFTITQISYR